MNTRTFVTGSYFDGQRQHDQGPYVIEVHDGVIRHIRQGAATTGTDTLPFLMPGLVEAHCHLFLNGGELDVTTRQNYLKAPRDQMLAVARRSLRENLAAGITLIRDAGDIHGVNTTIKAELAAAPGVMPALRSPGRAIRKAKRYGSFMALEVTDKESIARALRELAPTADDLKILLTGIIDFENGVMKGGVQFDLDEARLIVQTAHELGRLTYAHCSGREGLEIAVAAGIDSIEHGFFMERDILKQMADKGIAWVPTFCPVYFQHEHPELAGWNAVTVEKLWSILARHFEHIALACDMGVPIVAGSDAGSYGVPHGRGLIDELFFQRRAGMPLDKVVASATSLPRRQWKCAPADILVGNQADFVALAGSPFENMDHLRHVHLVCRHGQTWSPTHETAAAS
jgi:imidazolonepropionase-like amidohydrolase